MLLVCGYHDEISEKFLGRDLTAPEVAALLMQAYASRTVAAVPVFCGVWERTATRRLVLAYRQQLSASTSLSGQRQRGTWHKLAVLQTPYDVPYLSCFVVQVP